MNGPVHYKEAERLLALQQTIPMASDGSNPEADRIVAEAQVHATLALTAATAANIRRNSSVSEGGGDPYDWREAIGASRESRREAGFDA